MSSTEVKIPASLEEETAVRRLDDTTFEANLSPNYCVGSVPNGGYVATIFLRVAKEYLAHRNQPDTIVAHWEFLSRTTIGPAILVVEETKPGRSISVLHISLYQGSLLPQAPWISTDAKDGKPKSEKEVVAYVTNRSIAAENGITLATGWSIQPKLPPPVADFSKLLANQDPDWGFMNLLQRRAVTITQQLRIFRHHDTYANNGTDSVVDAWLCNRNGEPFKAPALGLVVDCTASFMPELHRPPTKDDPPVGGGEFTYKTAFWYPTLAMNLDVKKRLPDEGEKWLFVRSTAKQIYNGRFDIEIIVLDRAGDLVALSHHVAMMVNFEKNLAKRAAPAGIKNKI
ncbi:hypothetical protein ACHAQJ_003401 [Trichoderma viride]